MHCTNSDIKNYDHIQDILYIKHDHALLPCEILAGTFLSLFVFV